MKRLVPSNSIFQISVLQTILIIVCFISNAIFASDSYRKDSTAHMHGGAEQLESDELQQRQNPTRTIDMNAVPSCVKTYCLEATTETGSTNASSCSSFGDCASKDCSKISQDCFCRLPAALQCAWNCTWWNWMLAEDWHKETCPEADVSLNFTGVPKCASQCLRDQIFDYGCITERRDCFCFHGDVTLFGCGKGCKNSADLVRLDEWNQNTCRDIVKLQPKDAIHPPRQPARHLFWYEGFTVAAFFTSVLVYLGFLCWGVVWKFQQKNIYIR